MILDEGFGEFDGGCPILVKFFLEKGAVRLTNVVSSQIQEEVGYASSGPESIGDAITKHVVGDLNRIIDLHATKDRQARALGGFQSMVEFANFIAHQFTSHAG